METGVWDKFTTKLSAFISNVCITKTKTLKPESVKGRLSPSSFANFTVIHGPDIEYTYQEYESCGYIFFVVKVVGEKDWQN